MNVNRVASIDALRGFALLGILIVNMIHFQYATEAVGIIEHLANYSATAYYGIRILFQGTFFTIFAFLFGYSVVQLANSRKNKQLSYKAPLLKRGLLLLFIGILHYVIIWKGDILASYGVMVLIALALVNVNEKALKIITSVFIFLFLLMNTFMRSMGEDPTTLAIESASNIAYTTGTYKDVLINRITLSVEGFDFPVVVEMLLFAINYVIQLGMTPFLLLPFATFGMLMAKRQIRGEGGFTLKPVYIWLPLVVIGMACKMGLLMDNFIGYVLLSIGAILTTYGYMQLFLFCYEKLFSKRLQTVFESVGKMTISNYLMQSLILTTLFAQYGFGLSGKLGLWYGLLLSLALFIVQASCSYYIMKKYKQGPLEYLMRLIIYSGDKKQLKKQQTPTM